MVIVVEIGVSFAEDGISDPSPAPPTRRREKLPTGSRTGELSPNISNMPQARTKHRPLEAWSHPRRDRVLAKEGQTSETTVGLFPGCFRVQMKTVGGRARLDPPRHQLLTLLIAVMCSRKRRLCASGTGQLRRRRRRKQRSTRFITADALCAFLLRVHSTNIAWLEPWSALGCTFSTWIPVTRASFPDRVPPRTVGGGGWSGAAADQAWTQCMRRSCSLLVCCFRTIGILERSAGARCYFGQDDGRSEKAIHSRGSSNDCQLFSISRANSHGEAPTEKEAWLRRQKPPTDLARTTALEPSLQATLSVGEPGIGWMCALANAKASTSPGRAGSGALWEPNPVEHVQPPSGSSRLQSVTVGDFPSPFNVTSCCHLASRYS